MNLNALKPIGPHVTGFIRFAHEGEGEHFKQHDHFEILGRVHDRHENAAGAAAPRLAAHPIAAQLLAGDASEAGGSANEKLRSIPVKVIFDKPANNLTARYQAYDLSLGRLACAGDGARATRADFSLGSTSEHDCVGPEACEYANQGGVRCQLHVRLKVQIDGQADPFAVFEVQSSGINTFRTLSAKLDMMHAAFGGRLRHVPLSLTIFEKSSPLSSFEPFYVADLQLRSGISVHAAAQLAKEGADADATAGVACEAMEKATEAMASSFPLAIDDGESALVTFTPRLVDDVRLPRRETSSSSGLRPASISSLVEQARGSQAVAPAAAPVSVEPIKLTDAPRQSGRGDATIRPTEAAPTPL